jgi:hypothetical protein
MLIETARALLRGSQVLLPAAQAELVNPLVYSNAGVLGDAAFRRWLLWCNAARTVDQPAVCLGQYGPDTFIDGSVAFHVLTGDVLVREQLYLTGAELAAHLAHLRACAPGAEDVRAPCLLASHPGAWTWGHWLIDTLPKIVLAERACPGRFQFVVPAVTTDTDSSQFFVRSVLESLAAYGISPDRLQRLHAGTVYRFHALFDVVDMCGTDGMHPGVLAAMRALPSPPKSRGRQALTSVLRRGTDTRTIVNRAAIEPVLRAHGAAELDPGAAPFEEQVRAFRDSDVVVGDLGSNLAASLYAPAGNGIVTLAPGGWRDHFFGSLFQRLAPYHADVRGAAWPAGQAEPGMTSYMVDPGHLDTGLRAAARRPDGRAPVLLDGSVLPRALGPDILRIGFGRAGNALPFQRSGFSEPEAVCTWSVGACCTLVVPGFNPPAGDLWFVLLGAGFTVPPHLVSRPLSIAVNDVRVGDFAIENDTYLQMLVPRAALARTADLTLVFQHPVCPSPAAMGVSDDTRPLGFRFEAVWLAGTGR